MTFITCTIYFQIEAGDVILKVNGTDVHRYSTKEVLKCLRLSEDPVTLELKRDPNIKDHVRKYLATNAGHDIGNTSSIASPSSPIINTSKGHRISSSDSLTCKKSRIPVNTRIPSISAPQSPQSQKPKFHSQIPTANGIQQQQQPQKKQTPRFEAYMMTGDLILNLSRTPQSSSLIPTQAKKSTMDSLRDSPARSLKRKNGVAPKAIYDSSPSESSSASINELGSYEASENHIHHQVNSSSNDDNRKASKLSRYTAGDSHTTNESLDEEEEQLIEENNSNNPSPIDDDRNKKYNIGCANNTSSSEEASTPSNNSNSSNSSTTNNNYDGGGGSKGEGDDQNEEIGSNKSRHKTHVQKNQKYKVFYNEDQQNQQQQSNNNLDARQGLNVTPSLSMSSTTTTSSASTTINRSETLLTPTVDVNVSHSVPTSPTSLSTPLLETVKKRDLTTVSSVPTSPECIQQEMVVRRNSSNVQHQNGVPLRTVSGFRTSRSEDHLQHSQREGIMGHNAIPIDIDEDINSSLNTLLDTRNDSDSQVNFFIILTYLKRISH